MKSYLITILIRDGEHEYSDKTILELTDEQLESPSDIISLWRGFDDKPNEAYSEWYEFGGFDYNTIRYTAYRKSSLTIGRSYIPTTFIKTDIFCP